MHPTDPPDRQPPPPPPLIARVAMGATAGALLACKLTPPTDSRQKPGNAAVGAVLGGIVSALIPPDTGPTYAR